jgi:hypothetical protein
MKLKMPDLRKVRHVISAALILTGGFLATLTRDALAGILFIVLGVFVETAAVTIAISQQESKKQ